MKKFVSLFVVITVLCGVVNANEIDKPKSPVGMAVVKSGSGFKLFYQGVKRGNIKVTLYNSKGQVVHKETLRHLESFVRPYNLTALNEGEYTIEIIDQEGKQLQKIIHSSAKKEKLMNLVKVAGCNDKYMLSVANKGVDVLHIKIYDGTTLIYKETEPIQGDFAKIYKIDKIAKNFIFEITDKDGTTQSLTY